MKLILFFLSLLFVSVSFAQDLSSNYKSRKIVVSDTIEIDSVSINPLRFQVFDKRGVVIDSSDYHVDFAKSILILSEKHKTSNDSITLNYLRYPDYLTRDYFVLDSSIIVKNNSSINKLYSLQESTNKNNF